MNSQYLERSCMYRLESLCRLDDKPCSLCAQWRCADADLVDEVQGHVIGSDNRKAMTRRGMAEYYDLLMANESLMATFSTRNAEENSLVPSATVQSNMSHFKAEKH